MVESCNAKIRTKEGTQIQQTGRNWIEQIILNSLEHHHDYGRIEKGTGVHGDTTKGVTLITAKSPPGKPRISKAYQKTNGIVTLSFQKRLNMIEYKPTIYQLLEFGHRLSTRNRAENTEITSRRFPKGTNE